MSQSEVARIRAKIALEYQASQRIFTNFTATAQHQFITQRQENITVCFEELKRYISAEEAIKVLIQAEISVAIKGEMHVCP